MSVLQYLPRPVEIATIGAAKTTRRIEANERERASLAAALGLVDILSLSAELTLERDRRDTIHLEGRLDADIVQNCIVSLEPVRQRLVEPIRLRLVTAADGVPSAGAGRRRGEAEIDPTEDDPPEIVTGRTVDLGAIVVEHFVLAIDPYPRAPGAVLPDNPAREPADSGESPFAPLAGLVRPQQGER